MTEITNKELIEKLEQIHKLSDLGNIDKIAKEETNEVDIPEILKIKAQIRDLTERVEVLEKRDEQNIISLSGGDLREKKTQKKD